MTTIILLGAMERYQSDHPDFKKIAIMGYCAISFDTFNALSSDMRDSLHPVKLPLLVFCPTGGRA